MKDTFFEMCLKENLEIILKIYNNINIKDTFTY